MHFKPPTVSEKIKAIGSTKGFPDTLQKALDPRKDTQPINHSQPDGWLNVQHVTGQSFERFVGSKPNRPGKIRRTIYLQPLGQFPEGWDGLVEILKEFAHAYFTMEVQVLPRLLVNNEKLTTRTNPYTNKRQVLAFDVLVVLRRNLPPDAFCVLAMTVQDLYPDPSWNFVFGQASLRERVGIYSFARYDPAFYGEQRGSDYQKTLLRRGCKILVHETAHMFGLRHCIYFKCVVNGSNHLKENDSRPLHLCPVCLRKLQHSIGFDVVDRYRHLLQFYQKIGFDNDAQWITNRLKHILGPEAVQENVD